MDDELLFRVSNSLLFLIILFCVQILEGHVERESYASPLPYTYLDPEDLPEAFSWGNINGTSWISRSLNQHIPQVGNTDGLRLPSVLVVDDYDYVAIDDDAAIYFGQHRINIKC